MASTSRTTRNSQKAGISETLRSFAPAPTPDSNQPAHQPSPQISDFSLESRVAPEIGIIPPIPEEPPTRTHSPNGSHHSNHSHQSGAHNDDEYFSEEEPPKDAELANAFKMLAQNISKMSSAPKSSNAVKPRAPDTFDGTDPVKVDNYTFQCSMYIAARSKDFPDDESRVTFALSYLTGTPLDWFQTELTHAMTQGGQFPAWFASYPAFLTELRRLFGPRDPVNDAITALESLCYKDSTKATHYTLEFNRHSRRTGWNENALARHYYKGLPDRLKDEIAWISKPTQLIELQTLVATLDQRHWERQSEMSRDKKQAFSSSSSKSSDNRSDHHSENRTDRSGNTPANGNKTNGQQNQSRYKDQKKPASSTSPSAYTPKPASKTNSISDVLGPDGKLKPEERQHRMDNKLCLHCGEAGHVVSDCPCTSKPKPKGRAATTSTAPAPAAPALGKG